MQGTTPGVYVEEIGGKARAIEGAPTSVAAFVGWTPQGPRDADPQESPTPVASWHEYEQLFGGLHADSPLSYALRHFFEHGGRHALVVRAGGKSDDDLSAPELEAAGRGLWALTRAVDVNLVCVPPLSRGSDGDISPRTRQTAAELCRGLRAIFIADAPAKWQSAADVLGANGTGNAAFGLPANRNAALYFPQLRGADPLKGNAPAEFAPCGAVAGIVAAIDTSRGVWKAPAGVEAKLRGLEPAVKINDIEQGLLNPASVNCLRRFDGRGSVIWGARLWSTDPEWKYLSVRRLALYLETSIARGTSWACLEPNEERVWAALRRSVESFLLELFRHGAFSGARPDDAFYVRCGADTMSPADIAAGLLHIEVGFAPVRPAEFVVIRITHLLASGDPA